MIAPGLSGLDPLVTGLDAEVVVILTGKTALAISAFHSHLCKRHTGRDAVAFLLFNSCSSIFLEKLSLIIAHFLSFLSLLIPSLNLGAMYLSPLGLSLDVKPSRLPDLRLGFLLLCLMQYVIVNPCGKLGLEQILVFHQPEAVPVCLGYFP